MKLIYESSNGDKWFLHVDENGKPLIVHQPNLSSGGHRSHIEIGVFLTTGGLGPEKQRLLSLIAGLVEIPLTTAEAQAIDQGGDTTSINQK